MHRAICSPCHGVEEKLPPSVRAEVKDRYPRDRAVGFKERWRLAKLVVGRGAEEIGRRSTYHERVRAQDSALHHSLQRGPETDSLDLQ